MHAAVDGLMLEYRRAALFYGAGCGAASPSARAAWQGDGGRSVAHGCVAWWWQDEHVLPLADALRVAGL